MLKVRSGLPVLLLVACAADPDSEDALEKLNDVGTAAAALSLGANEPGDMFSYALAAGDFDGDGRVDLAVGAPGESPGSDPKSGIVFIFQGTAAGLVPWRTLSQESQRVDASGNALGALGQNDASDNFGHSLVAADLDHDGVTDLAVGAPHDLPGPGGVRSGAVYLYTGKKFQPGDVRMGLQPAQRLDQGLITGDPAANGDGDWFGRGLAAGDFLGDAGLELAVGASSKKVPQTHSGAVYLVRWSAPGATPVAVQTLTLPVDEQESMDQFGHTLAAGRLDGQVGDELAVGAPFRDSGPSPGAGFVYVYRRSGNSLTRWTTLDALTLPGSHQRFGADLAIGDVDGSGTEDLVALQRHTATVLVFRGSADAPPVLWRSQTCASDCSGFGYGLAVGQLDGSGGEDIAVGGAKVRVYTADSNGLTTWKTLASTLTSFRPGALVIADFDATGGNDLVVGDDAYEQSSGAVVRWLRQGAQLIQDQVITQE